MARQEKLWTPGPWSVSTDYAAMILVGPSDYAAVCDVETDIDDDGLTVPTPEQNANAHLISAAPDLVEALESIVNCWDGPLYRHEMLPNIEKARAALNAAYGDSQ